jgi:hypothetical protein
MLTKIANKHIDLTEIVYVSEMTPIGAYHITLKNSESISFFNNEYTTSIGEKVTNVFKQEELIQLINEATKFPTNTINKMKFINEGAL